MFADSEVNKKNKGMNKVVARLTVDKGEMQKKTSLKTKFSQFMDKRFYLSLHLFHPLLKEQEDLKKTTGKRLRDIFGIKKRNC